MWVPLGDVSFTEGTGSRPLKQQGRVLLVELCECRIAIRDVVKTWQLLMSVARIKDADHIVQRAARQCPTRSSSQTGYTKVH